MARGYVADSHQYVAEDARDYRPSRPARRAESTREVGREGGGVVREGGVTNHGYSAHYAESPVIAPPRESRSLPRRPPPRSHSKNSTLPRQSGGEVYRSPSRHTTSGTQLSKVTRSRSWGARPAGVVVYNRNGEPQDQDVYQQPTKPASVVGVGYRPGTALSGKTNKSGMTGISTGTVKSKNTTKAGVAVETMSAPNPFCPNTKGVCCLMVLINLALILVAIGFIIVLQLTEPAIVWNIGIVILLFGFLTLFISLVYCMCICNETPARGQQPGELYWTHHWQKNFTIPELSSKRTDRWEDEDKFPEDDVSDTSSRDYPRLYLESDYGQQTDREKDLDTDIERAEKVEKTKKYRKREKSPHDEIRHEIRDERDESPQRY